MTRPAARARARAAALALLVAATSAVTAGAPARAATPKAPGSSTLRLFASSYGTTWPDRPEGRTTDMATLRSRAAQLKRNVNITATGIVDRNGDGRDDDKKVTLHWFASWATVDLTANTGDPKAVTATGFTLRDRRAVLKESAVNLDRTLVFLQRYGHDSWNLKTIAGLKDEVAPGVRVTSDYDGNNDGFDDDGRLTLMKDGAAVTLTMGAREGQHGHVTYGATWEHPAKARTHSRPRTWERGQAVLLAKSFAGALEEISRRNEESSRTLGVIEEAQRTMDGSDGAAVLDYRGVTDGDADGWDDDNVIVVSMHQGRDVFRFRLPDGVGAKVAYTRLQG